MKKRHPRHSFVRSLRLLFSSAEKWEVLGRNMGGTWEPLTACADGLFWNVARLWFPVTKVLTFFHMAMACPESRAGLVPDVGFLFQKTIFTKWKSEVRQYVDRRCYIFEIWDNWDYGFSLLSHIIMCNSRICLNCLKSQFLQSVPGKYPNRKFKYIYIFNSFFHYIVAPHSHIWDLRQLRQNTLRPVFSWIRLTLSELGLT